MSIDDDYKTPQSSTVQQFVIRLMGESRGANFSSQERTIAAILVYRGGGRTSLNTVKKQAKKHAFSTLYRSIIAHFLVVLFPLAFRLHPEKFLKKVSA